MTAFAGTAPHPADDRSGPPHSIESEECILGAALSEPDYAPELLRIPTEVFFRPVHQKIHAIIIGMLGRGEPVDSSTVMATAYGMSPAYSQTVLSLIGKGFGASIGFHADRVIALAKARHLLETATRLTQKVEAVAYTDPDELAVIAGEAQAALLDSPGLADTTNDTGFDAALDRWSEWYQAPPQEGVIPTPWAELNDMLAGGLHPGRTYLWAGRPGGGKSVALLNLIRYAAELHHAGCVFSLEMPETEVMSRFIASGAEAEYGQITRRQMDAHNQDLVRAWLDAYAPLPVEIRDSSHVSIDEIAAHVLGRQRRSPLALAAIDYVQLLSHPDKSLPREQQVSYASRTAKILAKQANIPILMAAQLNREGVKVNRAPVLSDLRESGSLEQDADVVVLLHHPLDANGGPTGDIDLIVAKNRTGRCGTVRLPWRGYLARMG